MTTTATRPTADEALRAHGLDGRRLQKLAHRITQDQQRRSPGGLGGKYEDLHSFLVEQALRAAVSYDPKKKNPEGQPYTFESYLCDVMEVRVTDFYRRKSEGFGDRRSGSDGRLVLSGSIIEELADSDDEPDDEHDLEMGVSADPSWLRAARLASTPWNQWERVDEVRVIRWQRAAEALQLDIDEWLVITLDVAAEHQRRAREAA